MSRAFCHQRQRLIDLASFLARLSRRFGHAATDRQAAYLSDAEIRAQLARDPVVDALAAAIHAGIVPNLDAALEENIRIGELAREAFAAARAEPREMTEAALVARCGPQRRRRDAVEAVRHDAPPTESTKPSADETAEAGSALTKPSADETAEAGSASRTTKPSDMRQLMTRAITELMSGNERIVYVGEDVEHGGYYRVSEGLKHACAHHDALTSPQVLSRQRRTQGQIWEATLLRLAAR